MAITSLYSDIPTNFDIHPIKKDLVMITDDVAVKRSIRSLILTNPYERFFNPTLGSGITRSLFENINADTEYSIKKYVEETINNFEPRANLINVTVQASPDLNGYNVTIVFSINNNVNPITLTLALVTRVR